jgi:pimeloyl-ACP methyl ester carboxylesterase
VSVAKRAALATGALGGLAGTLYAAQRLAAARVRKLPDGDAFRALEPLDYPSRFLDTHDRGTIHVVENGNADDPPIVLSHGVTLSNRVWVYQLESLPKLGFRALAYEHRGHGHSVLGEAGHSVDNLADDVRTVLETLDLRGAVLVGHSLGGVATQAFAIRYPEIAAERVAGMVLLSSLAYTPFGSRSTQIKARLEKVMKRVPDGQWMWDSPNFGFVVSRLGFGKRPRPSQVELVRQMMAECTHETHRDAPRVLVGLDLTEGLPNISIPTLVVCGTADMMTPPSEARRMASLIPGARLELLRDGGHLLMLERAEAIDALIADFAREVRGGARRTA